MAFELATNFLGARNAAQMRPFEMPAHILSNEATTAFRETAVKNTEALASALPTAIQAVGAVKGEQERLKGVIATQAGNLLAQQSLNETSLTLQREKINANKRANLLSNLAGMAQGSFQAPPPAATADPIAMKQAVATLLAGSRAPSAVAEALRSLNTDNPAG
jgi:hypothetical protein